jgi:hypothetical protein
MRAGRCGGGLGNLEPDSVRPGSCWRHCEQGFAYGTWSADLGNICGAQRGALTPRKSGLRTKVDRAAPRIRPP